MLVEDEEDLVTLLTYNLQKSGYEVVSLPDGKKVVPVALLEKPDVMILDWMLPTLSGIDVCKAVRQEYRLKKIPILMLTARGTEGDKLMGFSVGLDDYMTKPFSIPELLARIGALLRRVPNEELPSLSYKDVSLDLEAHRVMRRGRVLHLGPTEFKLLHCFIQNAQKALSRAYLQKEIWGDIHVDDRTIDVHIKRLRKNLNANDEPDLIHTVRSVGYVMD